MGKLIIHFNIPTDEGPLEHCITFYKWLPAGKENALVRSNGNLTARLWIDKSCVRSLHSLTDEYISNWGDICVNKVYMDIEVQNVPEDLITFIYDERDKLRGRIHYGIKPGDKDYERLR